MGEDQLSILVTGGNGYIGSHLVRALARDGHRVTALMRQDGGELVFPTNANKVISPNYPMSDWKGEPYFSGVNVVIHTAGRVHRATEHGDAIQHCYQQDNVDFSLRMAELAHKAGVKRFIFLSSIGTEEIDNAFHQGRMTWKMAWEMSPYKASKLLAERALLAFGRAHGMEIIVIRLPMVYGKGAPGSFQKMLHWLRRRLPLPVYGIENPRAFVAIETVTDFIRLCLTHPLATQKVWAIRDKDEITAAEFALSLAEAGQLAKPRLWMVPLWLLNGVGFLFGFSRQIKSLTQSLHIDLTPVKQKLGWSPTLTVSEGLKACF